MSVSSQAEAVPIMHCKESHTEHVFGKHVYMSNKVHKQCNMSGEAHSCNQRSCKKIQHYTEIAHLQQTLHLDFGTLYLVTQPTIQGMLAVLFYHNLLAVKGDYGRI